ncbi:MAG: hypothetical protein QOI12_3573 [Alphaproteobacteria bacterium]|jgi:hypothetical protein|nr:hypothetical protein [Alphaproteobacteria bacterium]
MPLVFERIGRGGRRSALAVICCIAVTVAAGPSAGDTARPAADVLMVVLDRAEVLKLPDRVATLVVGNPLIADVSIQAGSLMVVTGKGYGSTNVLALDRAGDVLMQKTILVQGPRDNLLVVYRGVERESYSCTPICERRLMLGDSPAYFDSVIAQIGSRTGQAQSSSSGK